MCAWRKRNICKSIFNAYKETHTCIWRRQFCTKGHICLDLLEIINKEDIFAHIHRRKWQSHNGKTAINHSWVAQKLPRIRFSFVLITVSWFFVSFCLFFYDSQPAHSEMYARKSWDFCSVLFLRIFVVSCSSVTKSNFKHISSLRFTFVWESDDGMIKMLLFSTQQIAILFKKYLSK